MSVKHRMGIVAVVVLTAFAAGCGDDSTGTPGAPAWDLNENGECDLATEDLNGDGLCTMADVAGPPGVSCWDLNENSTCDLATEDLNSDGECTVLDCAAPTGFSCWDANENGTCDVTDEDHNGDGDCTTADCYGDPGITCWDLDENGTCDVATEDTNGDGDCTIADCNIPGTACWDVNANGTCDVATEDISGDGNCTIVDCSGISNGIVEGTVVDEAGAGIGGATVAFFPGSATTTADATGAYTIDLPIGVYSATASATGYTDGSADNISVVAGGTTTVDPIALVAVNPIAITPLTAQYQIGYGATTTVTASASGATGLTYSWRQTAGTTATLTGTDTATVTVTMPTLAACLTAAGTGYALRNRTELLPISPRIQGKITLTLTVTGGGFTKTTTVSISAAEVTGSVLDVPVGLNVYFQGAEAATYAWTLTVPTGSTATLRNGTTRTPSFVPDIVGTYTLALGTTTFSIVAGEWVGSGDPTCTTCHRTALTEYSATDHANIFAGQLDNLLGDPEYTTSCLRCHTVGYNVSATNGGFDEVMATTGWTIPETLEAGNWAAFQTAYPSLAQLANIQCENCHGPNDSDAHTTGAARTSLNSGMCSICHDSGSNHHKPYEWSTTAHANFETAVADGVTSTSCTRCHGAQGYLAYVDRLATGNAAPFTTAELTALGITTANVEPITCQTCHDPHGATNPKQLRQYDSIAMLPGGFGVSGVGMGAQCISCHNTRNGTCVPTTSGTAPWCGTTGPTVYWLHDDMAPAASFTSYSTAHAAAQGDVLMGVNAYFVGPGGFDVSPHAAISDTCVGCHMAPEAALADGVGDHTWMVSEEVCADCHGGEVNGAAIQATVAARLAEIGPAMANAVLADTRAAITTNGSVIVRAYDATTGCYSSTASGTSNVTLSASPTAATQYTGIARSLSFCMTMPAAVTWTKVGTGTGGAACSGDVTSTNVCFVTTSLKTGTPSVLVEPYNGDLSKAYWNQSLITNDSSGGLHNPVWVLDVLRNTLGALR
jgi:predicted CXXCH cytochrome family protein